MIAESGLSREKVVALVNLAVRLRALGRIDLEEQVSTRLLVYAASLIADGLDPLLACEAALVEPLSDDPEVRKGLLELVRATFG